MESQLLCMAIRRNSRLRQLHLSKAQADLRIDSVKALVESLEALHVQGTMLDVVTIGGLTFPLRQMAAGLMDSLDFASSTRHNRCALAPLLVFALDHSSGLRNLNFINNDFGAENEHVVDSVLRLAQRGLEVYNDLPLHGAAEGFDVQLRAVMPHGLCVFASTFLPRQRYLKHLNLQSCGLDARSLGAILLAVLQIQTAGWLTLIFERGTWVVSAKAMHVKGAPPSNQCHYPGYFQPTFEEGWDGAFGLIPTL